MLDEFDYDCASVERAFLIWQTCFDLAFIETYKSLVPL